MPAKEERLTMNTLEITGTQKHNKRRWGSLISRALLPLAVISAGAVIAIWMMETGPQAKPRPRSRNATLVSVRTVDYSPRQTVISGMGTVVSACNVELKPQVSGEVIQMSRNLVPGGNFRKGETLLKIDPTDYRLSMRELATDVAKAESELQLEQGNQLVAQKEYKLLGETVSEQEMALMLREPQLENLRATLEAARARLEQARVNLERTDIKAPFNAVVQSRQVNIGARASESTVLTTLVGTDTYWVEVSVPVGQLRWIRIPKNGDIQGSMVKIYDSAAWGDGVYREGRVIRLKAGIEEQGRMARLLVRVDDPLNLKPGNEGLPGMLMGSYVRVDIQGQAVPLATAIEREFIHNGNNVWVMDAKGCLDIRPVEIAFRGTESSFVVSGIKPGEKLITTDLAAPVTGMLLRTVDDNTGRTATEQTDIPEGQI